jgi:hypothetical protein
LYASNDGARGKTSRHLLRGKKQPQALSINFANTGSVAALLSFQAFDNDAPASMRTAMVLVSMMAESRVKG